MRSIQQIPSGDWGYQKDGIQYIFMPHISRTVTQSITTIANLYICVGLLRDNEELKRIGDEMHAYRPALYGEGA